MAEIRPFKALRFTEEAGDISELCCPPYDIISDDERRAYLAKNKRNIIRLELPREGDDPYAEAARSLKALEADGSLKLDERDSLYIYGESFTVDGVSYSFKGIIARVKLEEFSKGIILPHENTLSKAKQDRFELMNATMCNFSQIYSLFNDDGSIKAIISRLTEREPDVRFTDRDNVEHSLWVVSDPAACAETVSRFKDKKLYIADGHHRYETALNFRDHLRKTGRAKEGDACDMCMMMLVAMDDPGLVVFPTHRVVRGLDGFDGEKLLAGCRDSFSVEPADSLSQAELMLKARYDAGDKAFAVYFPHRFHVLTLRDRAELDRLCSGCSAALKGLDVTVLHTLVLERVLGIDKENMANQLNLTYTRDSSDAVRRVDSGEANCCFIMNPTRVREISEVAAAGEKMPQKSTYFYPKLITGLVMNKFGEI